jgi:predicted secreted Zn-dependent protease
MNESLHPVYSFDKIQSLDLLRGLHIRSVCKLVRAHTTNLGISCNGECQKATAEKGKKIWDISVMKMVEFVESIKTPR